LRQSTLFEKGILPKEQSSQLETPTNELKSKPYFVMKKLSKKSKDWLENSLTTNWSQIISKQNYTTKKKILKILTWTLLGLDESRDYCGNWLTKGCFNTSMHPKGLPFVRRFKRSCFRANCEKCWLEKWLARESSRATRRIEKYQDLAQRKGWRNCKPIHIVISPSWKDKELDFGELKDRVRVLLEKLDIDGGLMIYHTFKFDKKGKIWKENRHFHIIGYGWLNIDLFQKMLNPEAKEFDSNYEKWVVKNLGTRKSLHSTVYYQLSHVGFAKGVQSVTWFGELSYRAKYSKEIKVEQEKDTEFCVFCGFFLVNCEFKGKGEPPPFEFEGSVLAKNWRPLESVDEAIERKESMQYRSKKEANNVDPYFNWECRLAYEKAELKKKLMDYCWLNTIVEADKWFLFFFREFFV